MAIACKTLPQLYARARSSINRINGVPSIRSLTDHSYYTHCYVYDGNGLYKGKYLLKDGVELMRRNIDWTIKCVD